MRKLSVFNSVTLDGYFTGEGGNYDWAHATAPDPKFSAFVEDNAKTPAVLVFGRVTYELMAAYWPTAAATKAMPKVAEQMNSRPKIVFSKHLDTVSWENTTIMKSDPASAIRRLKKQDGDDMVILGSGSIVSRLTQAGLIDEYQVVVVPVIIGEGRTMFEGIKKQVALTLTKSRAFDNGNTFLRYVPSK